MKKLTALVGLGLVASVGLTGCAALHDAATSRHDLQFDSYTAAHDDWSSLPSWIPTDATAIRLRETTNAPIAVVKLTSSTDPVGCEPADRKYVPGIGGGWLPTDYPHSVLRCGDWEVMPIEGGWFGWTVSETDMAGELHPAS